MTKQTPDPIAALHQSGVIAYPTEAVFGLGCDPDNEAAVMALLAIKQRPVEKGLILVAANREQLAAYVDFAALTSAQLARVEATWPGPHSWVIAKQPKVPTFLSGQFDSLAVRVSAHPEVQKLCLAFGKPLVSTSANFTGQPPCRTTAEVDTQMGHLLAAIQPGDCDINANPSQIRDAKSNQILRPS
ncbi:Sua5/YciO/YrdC/YwlC family protein [Neiella marina]|uniref:Threonylcarbamoyl-AMP synthase n=1 Tax=Neiella holothuriorum TaxID=2870530 RepID=A0ABS7EKC1_9GAMM|nr:Sua5/YciO/YrdC/YwlC family protein [Neiella holothuriorum]MBW8192786.1 Sua5/YciO/YrdC/YwlC family protein [Neiella holothuriorum]